MSLTSRIFSGPTEKRELTSANFLLPPTWYNAGYQEFGHGGALSLSIFFACVRLLSDTVSDLRLFAYRGSTDVPVMAARQPDLLKGDPYPGISWHAWLWMVMESLCTNGNAYLHITSRDDRNRALALKPVHPRWVNVSLPNGDLNYWDTPNYTILGHAIPREDIVHIKRFPVAGEIYGMSPVEKLAGNIRLSLNAEKYGNQFFQDAADPRGVLSTAQDVTDTQVKETARRWMRQYSDRRLPAILGNGYTWEQTGIAPEESQFLATRKHQHGEIAAFFGVPPHMVGDTEKSTSFGAGIDAQKDGFVTFTVRNWLECIEQAISPLIPSTMFAKFDLTELMRGDPKVLWETVQMGILAGVLSINEGRAMVDLPPIPGGDIRITPMNYVPLGTPVSEYVPAAGGNSSDDSDSPAGSGDKGDQS